jgi:DNA polymerase-3 subunit delta
MVTKGEVTIPEMNRLLKEEALGGVYLFCGPEEYFKDYYCNQLKGKTVGEDVLNYTKYTVKTDPSDIISNCSGYPMFASMKMIVMCESGYFSGKGDYSALAEFMGEIPPTTVLVFRETNVDKRGKLYKAVEKNGVVFQCERQSPDMIVKLLAKAAKSKDREITKDAAQLMIMGLGEDMQRLLSELEKLILLTDPGEIIEEAHVREVCALSVSSKIWELTDAMSDNNKEKAYVCLKALLDAKEVPQVILFSVTKAFINLYNTKMLQQEGYRYAEIASMLGTRDFVVKKMCQQAQKYSAKDLSDKIDFCIHMDEASKTGKMNTVRALELIAAK